MSRALERIAELVQRESGFRISGDRRLSSVGRAMATALPGIDAETFLQRAAHDGGSLACLLDELTVKETFFNRDEQQLRTIDWRAMERRARARGSDDVQVWTAGCATGEEPYSLALLALETFGVANPPVRILGTDISRTALARARQGRYRERSVRLLTQAQRSLHFERDVHETTQIGARARDLVHFAHHNLVRDLVPTPGAGGFDLVLCRNVLIYFDAETVVAVLDRLRQALRPEGRLMLGAADTLCLTAATLDELERRTIAGAPPAREPLRPSRPRAKPATAVVPPAPSPRTHFVQGLVELERGETGAAIAALRRALYLEPSLAVAAFQLGRVHEASGDLPAAIRAYEQTLRTLDEYPRSDELLEQIDPVDVALACRKRIAALT